MTSTDNVERIRFLNLASSQSSKTKSPAKGGTGSSTQTTEEKLKNSPRTEDRLRSTPTKLDMIKNPYGRKVDQTVSTREDQGNLPAREPVSSFAGASVSGTIDETVGLQGKTAVDTKQDKAGGDTTRSNSRLTGSTTADRLASYRSPLDNMVAENSGTKDADTSADYPFRNGFYEPATTEPIDDYPFRNGFYEPLTTAPTQDQTASLNALATKLMNADHPSAHATAAVLKSELAEIYHDPVQAREAFNLLIEGTPADIVYAEVTDNWSAIPGGNPDYYGLEEKRTVIEQLGIELPESLSTSDIAGIDEIISTLPDVVTAGLFTTGVTQDINGSLGLITPGGLVLPVGASATLNLGGEVSLSKPQIGVGFTQTHEVEISATLTADIYGRLGKSTLQDAYKSLSKIDRFSKAAENLLGNSPLMRHAIKGLPFSLEYSRFAGGELTYSALINSQQAAALDAGDGSVLPDIFAPQDLLPGTSLLIRGGAIEGSTFAATYKMLHLEETTTEFDGLGFGVSRLEDGRVAIYSGPIEAIEQSSFLGLKKFSATAGISNSTELSSHDFAYAELDLNTQDGMATYQNFISGGGVPSASDHPGVLSGQIKSLQMDSEAAVSLGVGSYGLDWEISSKSGVSNHIAYADGRSRYEFIASYDDAAVQVDLDMTDDAASMEEASLTLVVEDIVGDPARLMDSFVNGSDPGIATDVDLQNVQLTLTADDITQLREIAQQVMETDSGDFYEPVTDIAPKLARAGSNEEAINEIMKQVNESPKQLIDNLLIMGADYSEQTGKDPYDGVLPGSYTHIAAN